LCYYTSRVACPYFFPVNPWHGDTSRQSAMLPLGGNWTGVCHAIAEKPCPAESSFRTLCNLGYARGSCQRFPDGASPDATRFTISREEGDRVQIYYVVERDHLPYSHGPLGYSLLRREFLDPVPNEIIRRQAEAYIESYLRRKSEASA
jgi:hypothetical protein